MTCEANDQCERNPQCRRGYKHRGQGGHCSIKEANTAEVVLPEEGSAEDQCEKNPDCSRGFRHRGRGGRCSSRSSVGLATVDESEVDAEARERDQCERNPECTRGYRHHGKGGRCSFAHASIFVESEAIDESEAAELDAQAEATDQCERHPDCTRGYKHHGRGGRCSNYRAVVAEAEAEAESYSLKCEANDQCERNDWCRRGFRHRGRGGHCSMKEAPAAADAENTSAPDRPKRPSVAAAEDSLTAQLNRCEAMDQCERTAGCTRGFRHHGRGGFCSFKEPHPKDSSANDEDEEECEANDQCERTPGCTRGFRHRGRGGHCSFKEAPQSSVAASAPKSHLSSDLPMASALETWNDVVVHVPAAEFNEPSGAFYVGVVVKATQSHVYVHFVSTTLPIGSENTSSGAPCKLRSSACPLSLSPSLPLSLSPSLPLSLSPSLPLSLSPSLPLSLSPSLPLSLSPSLPPPPALSLLPYVLSLCIFKLLFLRFCACTLCPRPFSCSPICFPRSAALARCMPYKAEKGARRCSIEYRNRRATTRRRRRPGI